MNERLTIKNYIRETRLFRLRLIIAVVVAFIATLLLVARLVDLQILQHKHYTTLSAKNDIDLRPMTPRRGIIYDRNGVILAKNIPVFSLMVRPDRVKDLKNALSQIKGLITISDDDLQRFQKALKQHRKFDEIPLKVKLNDQEVAIFEVNRFKFPGFSIQAELIRSYPFQDAFAHVLGYVGRINTQELDRVDASNYAGTNFIGKVGIEKYYESQLHGEVGYSKVETDASGEVLRTLDQLPPIKGEDIYLTIDSQLQIAAKNALNNKPGAIVAIQPSTGQVLALVSQPAYDPNDFVIGISHKEFNALQSDMTHPLYNRALRGLYPPGSTIKPFIALAGLSCGTVTPKTRIFDPGWYQIPGTKHIFRDWTWRQGGHGWTNLNSAIVESCDTYFYILAHKLGIDRIDDMLAQFGFGKPTGIDMGEELGGNIPTPEWKWKVQGTKWYAGDTVQTSIGQGYTQTTPLQLAAATATLANRGARFQPQLLYAVKTPDGEIAQTDPTQIDPVILNHPNYWDVVLKAMQGVITKGTGYRFGRPPYTVAAKTGTAQVSKEQYDKHEKDLNIPEQLRDNSVFIAFAPFDHPQIAVAVIVEHNMNAPIVARKVLDYYLLSEKHLNCTTTVCRLPTPLIPATNVIPAQTNVIPAKAGIQTNVIPAKAGIQTNVIPAKAGIQ
ncbi:MAG: penicillin-binding protein 2 [Gammaproteobacteria bacterium]|nr:penicillin-binding protein 2 [Gammaproteobacteria bacterium]MBU1927129.1 penicillin-binding protein 2 [Gammaproteobacteria bacterium]MBU2545907.1 penicillin-binding protein 2 [Gammaproteobacteria bacterium]